MRIRRKPGVNAVLDDMPDIVVKHTKEQKVNWEKVFNNNNSLYLELGCGKGGFISTQGELNPHINFIGVERVPEVLYISIKKWKRKKLKNLRYLLYDVEMLPLLFEQGQIARIYLNFSDPWPKNRHAKRRLTHPKFLDIYKYLLKHKGEIHMKTDNENLFEFSLQNFADEGFSLRKVTRDLHSIKNNRNKILYPQEFLLKQYPEYIMTEYERRFTNLGQPIYRLEAIKR